MTLRAALLAVSSVAILVLLATEPAPPAIVAQAAPPAAPAPPPPSDAPRGTPLGAGAMLTQGYGVGSHAPAETWGGVDLALDTDGDGMPEPYATEGAPVYAVMDGEARQSTTATCGNGVELLAPGWRLLHCHLSAFGAAGPVRRGDVIGYVGSTGQSSGPHLHYEVWRDGVNVNPLDYGVLAAGAADLHIVDEVYAGGLDVAAVLAQVVARYGSGLRGPTTIAISQSPGCELHGITYPDERIVQVWTCEAIGVERASVILAHEFAHQLAYDRLGWVMDPLLSEGMASYYGGWTPADAGLPLTTDPAGEPQAMNTMYAEWAAFVAWIEATYGREALDALARTGDGTIGSADYAGVLGVELGELERMWRG